MRWFAKTFTGLLVALAILAVGGYFAANYVFAQFAKLPPKPTFPNDDPQFAQQQAKAKAVRAKARANAEKKSGTKAKSPDAKSTPTSEEKPQPEKKPLPPGAFEGQVTQPIGLILRDTASRDAGQIGGIAFNEKVIVLETTSDGQWQRIRTSRDREGWVRGGNIDKLSAGNPPAETNAVEINVAETNAANSNNPQ
ncbi:MAG: SH3 domain-containing protein [Synechococcales bacterium]|nr:SH3 domain-containing protein [Synechococcales bacterium]